MSEQINRRIDKLEEQMQGLETRFSHLDKSVSLVEADRQYVRERIDAIDDRLKKISGHLTWLIYIVLGGIVSGLVTFIMQGGMAT